MKNVMFFLNAVVMVIVLTGLGCSSKSSKKESVDLNDAVSSGNKSTADGGSKANVENETDFEEVRVGKQVWMAENLNVDKFRNGDPIPHAKTDEEWETARKEGKSAWCYYDNDPAKGEKYGKLYNFYAVNDKRKLAPAGWHLPSEEDWNELIDFLGEKAGVKIKSTTGWKDNGNGTNESNYSGLPAGYRGEYGEFNSIGSKAKWWWSTENIMSDPRNSGLRSSNDNVINKLGYDGEGLSVRCLKD